MRAPAWEGDWPITAGEYYSSGTYHGSWDIGMPDYTNILAPVDGVILDEVHGVPNISGGPGSPSNWILLGFDIGQGVRVCYYFQHLATTRVHKGEKVEVGDHIGESGHSGHASGAHLHLTLQHGWKQRYTRYDYLTHHNAFYPPDSGWERWDADMGLSHEDREWIKEQIDHSIEQSSNQAAKKVWEEMLVNTNAQDNSKYKAQWFLNKILKNTG